jgi:SAM-dependent methyltransferase
VRQIIKSMVPNAVRWKIHQLKYWGSVANAVIRSGGTRTCIVCGYVGLFGTAGMPVRVGAVCPVCRSGERHRLLYQTIEERKLLENVTRVVHFAPERCVGDIIRKRVPEYISADIVPGRGGQVLNIEKINLPDASADLVLALHILEHVNDRMALSELHRILSPEGVLITAVPIIEAWPVTYENPSLTSERDRELHFGASDHARWYGHDFRERLTEAGFTFEECVAGGMESVKFGFVRGDTIFLCRKA